MQEDHASPTAQNESTAASELEARPAPMPAPETPTASEVVDEQAATEVAEVGVDIAEAKRALEAVLLAANEPMPLNELKRVFDGELAVETIRNLLDELKLEWAGRAAELVTVASGYRFRVLPSYQKYLDRLSNDKPPRYSRAVLETLAIITYRQPVTRGDIEDIRGVAVSPHILKTLEDRGWIEEIGHRETVGRPALFATTKHFLDDLNLRSVEELPPLHELQATLDMNHALNTNSVAGMIGLDAAVSLTPMLPSVSLATEPEAGNLQPAADVSMASSEDVVSIAHEAEPDKLLDDPQVEGSDAAKGDARG